MDNIHTAIRATANAPCGRHRLDDDIPAQPLPAVTAPGRSATAERDLFGIPLGVALVLALTLVTLLAVLVIA